MKVYRATSKMNEMTGAFWKILVIAENFSQAAVIVQRQIIDVAVIECLGDAFTNDSPANSKEPAA